MSFCGLFVLFVETEKRALSPDGERSGGSGACRFTLQQLAAATQNFREANLIGEGGFGRVYKGFLESGQVNELFIFFN